MSFTSDVAEEDAAAPGGQAYIDMLNDKPAEAPEAQTVVSDEPPAPAKQTGGKRSPAKKRGRTKKDDSGLKTL